MSDAANDELVTTREYDATAQMLFDAFSQPRRLMKWFGPVGWPVTLCEVDFRVGGAFRMAMTGPDGAQTPAFGGTYLEIIPCSRIVFDNGFEAPGSGKMTWTVTFDEADGLTTLTVGIGFPTAAMRQEYLDLGLLQGLDSALSQIPGVLEDMKP